jgi:hypothetical protein
MDYSLAEQVVLTLSEVAIEAYHMARERPRTFWGLWAVGFAAAALVLLKPGHRHASTD